MSIAWQATDFDTEPYEIATTQRETFTYSLPEASAATVTSAAVRMLRLDTFEAEPDLVSVVGTEGKIATVLVDATAGMVRGQVYELLVTLTASDGDTEPMRTIFPCMA